MSKVQSNSVVNAEVKAEAVVNTVAGFDLDKALEVAQSTEARTRSGARGAGEFQSLVLAMLNKAGVLTINQIKAGLEAVGFKDVHGNSVTNKYIADRIWTYAKNGKCAFGDASGQYMSIAHRAANPKAE